MVVVSFEYHKYSLLRSEFYDLLMVEGGKRIVGTGSPISENSSKDSRPDIEEHHQGRHQRRKPAVYLSADCYESQEGRNPL